VQRLEQNSRNTVTTQSAPTTSSTQGNGSGEIRRLLEFGLAPGNLEFVIEQQVAGSVDDDMRLAPAVRAFELVQAVDLGIAVVDFSGNARWPKFGPSACRQSWAADGDNAGSPRRPRPQRSRSADARGAQQLSVQAPRDRCRWRAISAVTRFRLERGGPAERLGDAIRSRRRPGPSKLARHDRFCREVGSDNPLVILGKLRRESRASEGSGGKRNLSRSDYNQANRARRLTLLG